MDFRLSLADIITETKKLSFKEVEKKGRKEEVIYKKQKYKKK